MDALTLTTACILCAMPPTTPPNVARWEPIIVEASTRFAVPEIWIERVMGVESAGLTMLNGKPITSSAGAMGLMQLMPSTYAALRKHYGFGADPYDPRDNILAGAAYLKAMYVRYGYPLLFAAYLTGPTHLDVYLSRPEGLPSNVVTYVNDIVPGAISDQEVVSRQSNSSAQQTKNPRANDLFFIRSSVPIPGQPEQKNASEIDATGLKSVFAGTDHSASLFVSQPSQNR